MTFQKYSMANLALYRPSTAILESGSSALDDVHPDIHSQALKLFRDWLPALRFNTFMACVSEHLGGDPETEHDEDQFGRLSMWRAYGGAHGVALVLDSGFLQNPDLMNMHTTPVLYADGSAFHREFSRVVENIENNRDSLAALGPDQLAGHIFRVFRFAVLGTKHPAYWEEREWRVVHTPAMGDSAYTEKTFESVNGVPQTVYKIKLKNDAHNGVSGVDLLDLLDRLIIGPTDHALTAAQAIT